MQKSYRIINILAELITSINRLNSSIKELQKALYSLNNTKMNTTMQDISQSISSEEMSKIISENINKTIESIQKEEKNHEKTL